MVKRCFQRNRQKKKSPRNTAGVSGAPCATRTRNLLIRSQVLYPIELMALARTMLLYPIKVSLSRGVFSVFLHDLLRQGYICCIIV